MTSLVNVIPSHNKIITETTLTALIIPYWIIKLIVGASDRRMLLSLETTRPRNSAVVRLLDL